MTWRFSILHHFVWFCGVYSLSLSLKGRLQVKLLNSIRIRIFITNMQVQKLSRCAAISPIELIFTNLLQSGGCILSFQFYVDMSFHICDVIPRTKRNILIGSCTKVAIIFIIFFKCLSCRGQVPSPAKCVKPLVYPYYSQFPSLAMDYIKMKKRQIQRLL